MDLEQAARALLEAMDEAERAERAEGGPKGGFIPRPATHLWNAGVFHAAAKCAAAKANLRAALAAESGRVSGWQPIATAPKDGTRILVSSPEIGRCVASAGWHCDTPNLIRWEVVNDITVLPTHWQPLPEPPTDMLAAAQEGSKNGS